MTLTREFDSQLPSTFKLQNHFVEDQATNLRRLDPLRQVGFVLTRLESETTDQVELSTTIFGWTTSARCEDWHGLVFDQDGTLGVIWVKNS